MARPPSTPRRPQREIRPHRINEEITAGTVRLVGEENEADNGLIPLAQALQLARERELDLVEIAGQVDPPIVRIIEYSKFRYEQKKKEKESKAKQHVVEVKEIRFGPNTGEHDFNFKLKHAQKFLQEGNKIKAYVQFRGRAIVHKERGEVLLNNFSEQLAELAKLEMAPKLEGKRMFIILTPKK